MPSRSSPHVKRSVTDYGYGPVWAAARPQGTFGSCVNHTSEAVAPTTSQIAAPRVDHTATVAAAAGGAGAAALLLLFCL